MCARGCTFPFELEILLSSQDSGISALKKETLRRAFQRAWDRKLAGCVKCDPPLGKRRQQAAVYLPASIGSKKVADPMGNLQLKAPFKEPGTENSQDAGNASLLQA